MSKLVTIFGGSGFIGRYIARRMAREGWRVRVAVRRPNEALFVRPYGAVGQVEPVFCNIRDDASVQAVLAGADAVVNCVGILAEAGRNRFDAVQSEGAGRIARLAAAAGIGRMVHISAIGADPDSASAYARSKAAGEAAVLAHQPEAVILRPSIVFGQEDQVFNRFAGMARFSLIVPLVGAQTRFQPVYVDDVAAAAVKGVLGQADPGVYELGGPEVGTFRDFIVQMLRVIRRRRLVVNIPFALAGLIAGGCDLVAKVSLGLIPAALTRDQVRSLKTDNVVSGAALGFADLGIDPVSSEAILDAYLWRFRVAGQYADQVASGKNLKV
ncbi:MAG: complex I NDUFA9 subunit family protein [Qingshengfaniella sp.]